MRKETDVVVYRRVTLPEGEMRARHVVHLLNMRRAKDNALSLGIWLSFSVTFKSPFACVFIYCQGKLVFSYKKKKSLDRIFDSVWFSVHQCGCLSVCRRVYFHPITTIQGSHMNQTSVVALPQLFVGLP